MEITACFEVPYWECERESVPVKLRLGRRKAGKEMKSKVQNLI